MPTPLHTALKLMNQDLTLYLLSLPQDHHLDVDFLTDPATPLHHACRLGLTRVVEALMLHHGVDLSQQREKFPCTPLLMAAQMGHLATVDLLLEMYQARGLLGHALKRSGLSAEFGPPIPLLHACTAEREEEYPEEYVKLARLLVEKWGLPVPLPTDEYRPFNTFGLAIRNACVPLLDFYLTARGGPIDTPDPLSGRTIRHVVCFYEQSNDADCLKCVRFLVEAKGADPCALTNDGCRPGEYALHRRKVKTYEFLARRGGGLQGQDPRGGGGGGDPGRLKLGKKLEASRAHQAKTTVEPSPETVRQAEARAKVAEESLLAELEVEEAAARQALLGKKNKKGGNKSNKGEKKGAGAEDGHGELGG